MHIALLSWTELPPRTNCSNILETACVVLFSTKNSFSESLVSWPRGQSADKQDTTLCLNELGGKESQIEQFKISPVRRALKGAMGMQRKEARIT